ncbi:MAG TPA: hypothetical protein PLY88_04220 [Candidatus Omnitrophota bacterium]|nr:hypothetical protein [Candidatus Omnitrophota bacterium]HRK61738.1 hypothetical protein [Candidatus Omnitrophota bacterium]
MRFSFAESKVWLGLSLSGWILIQVPFFLPQGLMESFTVYFFKSSCGEVAVIQSGRSADLIGACSDRYQRFARFDLVPALRRNGVARIRKIVLKGHGSEQTAALPELQKNFQVDSVYYPPDRAERMRKTFRIIDRNVCVRRLEDRQGS